MRDLVETAILLAILQAVVLAPVLWARRANQLANRILAVLVAAVALMMVLADLEGRWAFNGQPHLLALSAPLPFLFGPLVYLYVVGLTRPLVRFDPRWLAHALPFIADVLYMTQAFFLKGGAEKVAIAREANAGHAPISFYAVSFLEVIQALVYLFLSWKALEQHGKRMQGYFSDLTRIDLRWLRILVLVHVAVWSVVLLSVVLRVTRNEANVLGPIVQFGSSIAIFVTGYVSLWQPELAQKSNAAKVVDEETPKEVETAEPHAEVVPPTETEPAVESPAPSSGETPLPNEVARPKYQRNRLDDGEAKELVTKLETLMASEQLYRESGLTLPTLADAVGVTPHMLSQVLNVRVGKSFFVFVNAYRAEALKEALADTSRSERGVLELALEVGFSSKSTVNSFFKKHTGMTPTDFRGRVSSSKNAEKSGG